jgi:hypothetical protein
LAVTKKGGGIIGKISLGDVLQRIQDAMAVLQARPCSALVEP